MNGENEIDELRDLLENLIIQQQETNRAITRVERLIRQSNVEAREAPVAELVQPAPTAPPTVDRPVLRNLQLRDFARGQHVRILNPTRGEEDTGVVTGVGTRFVNIARSQGRDTRRIPRNLEIIRDI